MEDKKKAKPYHFIEPDDALVSAYAKPIEDAVNSESGTVVLMVPPANVETLDVSLPQEIVLALQHHPHYIEDMLFSIDFKFPEIAGSELYIPEQEWKRSPMHSRWFSRLHTQPHMLFFARDADVRFRILAGDLLADNKLPVVQQLPGSSKVKIEIKGPLLDELCNRLLLSCYFFMVYCHNSGFNTKRIVEAMLADYSLPVHYKQAFKLYERDIKAKVCFWSKPDFGQEDKAA